MPTPTPPSSAELLAGPALVLVLAACGCVDERATGSDTRPGAAPTSKLNPNDDNARPEAAASETALREGPAAGDVVVIAGDTQLYTAARDDAARVAWELDAAARYAFEVRGSEGEFVALRTMSPRRDKQRTCARVPVLGNYYELELFVRRSALGELLLEPLTLDFEQGAKLAFAPGVPVASEPKQQHELWVGDLRFAAALDPAHIGRWLPAAKAKRQPPRAGSWVPHGVQLHYGEHSLVGMEQHRHLGAPIAAELEETGGRSVVFQGACGRFVLREPQHPEPEPPPELQLRERLAGGLALGGQPARPSSAGSALVVDCSERWFVPAETALSWPSGHAAGHARRPHPLPASAAPEGERHCFTREGVELCVPVAKLERQPASAECGG